MRCSTQVAAPDANQQCQEMWLDAYLAGVPDEGGGGGLVEQQGTP